MSLQGRQRAEGPLETLNELCYFSPSHTLTEESSSKEDSQVPFMFLKTHVYRAWCFKLKELEWTYLTRAIPEGEIDHPDVPAFPDVAPERRFNKVQHEIAAVLFRDDVERLLAYVFKEMTWNKEGYTSPNSAILSMTGTNQDNLQEVDIPAPVTYVPSSASKPEVVFKPTILSSKVRDTPKESVRSEESPKPEGSNQSEESQSEKVLTPVREQGESIPQFTPLNDCTTGPMPATPGSFLDIVQSQAFEVPPMSMHSGFRGLEDSTEVSDFTYRGVTPLYRVGPRPSGILIQPMGAHSSIALTGLSEIPEDSEASTAIPEVQLPGRRKRVSIISSILNYPPPTAFTSKEQKPIE